MAVALRLRRIVEFGNLCVSYYYDIASRRITLLRAFEQSLINYHSPHSGAKCINDAPGEGPFTMLETTASYQISLV